VWRLQAANNALYFSVTYNPPGELPGLLTHPWVQRSYSDCQPMANVTGCTFVSDWVEMWVG
jgi:hypothetical protein